MVILYDSSNGQRKAGETSEELSRGGSHKQSSRRRHSYVGGGSASWRVLRWSVYIKTKFHSSQTARIRSEQHKMEKWKKKNICPSISFWRSNPCLSQYPSCAPLLPRVRWQRPTSSPSVVSKAAAAPPSSFSLSDVTPLALFETLAAIFVFFSVDEIRSLPLYYSFLLWRTTAIVAYQRVRKHYRLHFVICCSGSGP